jgi:hypothetical protein
VSHSGAGCDAGLGPALWQSVHDLTVFVFRMRAAERLLRGLRPINLA